VAGELLDSDKARQTYTEIVRRTQDPGLLEYLGNNLMRLRVFPIAPKSDQKITLRFASVAQQDAGIVEYVYPLKTDGKATQTLEDFSLRMSIRTQKPLQSVYSPTHAVSVNRTDDRNAAIVFERNQATLDKDFQLFYSIGGGGVGLTPLTFRPLSSEDGYFLFLINPHWDSGSAKVIPRDVVLVLDTSGSMEGDKIKNAAESAVNFVSRLHRDDEIYVIGFGGYEVRVHHTPGHCPGGVCLQIGKAGNPGKDLFVGDTLFASSIGRADLPGGDFDTLMASIKNVLFAFGDDAIVHPGHGPDTTIGRERRTNPFVLEYLQGR
jgi:hypothetical protein